MLPPTASFCSFEPRSKWRNTARLVLLFSGLFWLLSVSIPAMAQDGKPPQQVQQNQVQQPDQGGHALAPSTQSRMLSRITITFQFCVAMGLLFWIGLRHINRKSLVQTLPWICIGAVALFLRLYMVSGSVFHENHHGYKYIMAMVEGMTETYGGFASSYIVLMHEVIRAFGSSDQTVFVTNSIMSSMSCIFLGLLATRVSGSQVAGWTAAIMWAVTPYSIRLASTEIYGNFVTFFFLAATLATITAMDVARKEGLRASTAWIIIAVILIVLEARGRVMTLIHPLGVLLLVLGCGAGKTRDEAMGLVLGAIAAAGLLITQGIDILRTSKQATQTASLIDPMCNWTQLENFSALDASVLSAWLVPLALVGAAFLVMGVVSSKEQTPPDPDQGRMVRVVAYLKGRWRPISTLAGIFVVIVLAGSVCGTFSSRVRLELTMNCLLTLLAGVAAGGAVVLARTLLRQGAYLIPVAVIASSWLSPQILDIPFHEFEEYALLQEKVIPAMEKEGTSVQIIIPNAPRPTGEISLSWWKKELPHAEIVRTAEELNRKGPLYAYVGLECSWSAPGSEGPEEVLTPFPKAAKVEDLRIHPQCARDLGPYQWEKVDTIEVPRAYKGLAQCNPCIDIKPTVDSAAFGLFKAK